MELEPSSVTQLAGLGMDFDFSVSLSITVKQVFWNRLPRVGLRME